MKFLKNIFSLVMDPTIESNWSVAVGTAPSVQTGWGAGGWGDTQRGRSWGGRAEGEDTGGSSWGDDSWGDSGGGSWGGNTEGSTSTLPDDVIFVYKLLVCVIGCLGNIINIIVINFTKVPKITRITISVLAVSDFCYLLQHSPTILYPKLYNMSFFNISDLACQLTTFAGVFFAFVSSIMVVTLTVSRVIAVVRPLHASRLLSARNLFLGVSLPILADLAGIGYLASQYTLSHVYDNNNRIIFSSCFNLELREVMQYFGVLINMVIPLFIVVLGNIIIVVSVVVKRKQLSELESKNSNRAAGELKLVVTTVSISLAFIFLTTPLAIYYTFGERILGPKIFVDWTNIYYLSCDAVYYTNFAVNFFLYMAFTKSFRDELGAVMKKFGLKCGSPGGEGLSESGTGLSSLSSVSQRVDGSSAGGPESRDK